ncbi:MAG: hypothetical protein P1V35_17265 [Planctomycetota bacterium]|nr:hypothetical protein [Planctomycetota bacterium]
MSDDEYPREKEWRHLYLRSEKLHRAKQLGIDYPRKHSNQLKMEASRNVLFVCSKNQWRSPTAESVFKDDPMLEVRSRGVSRDAKRTISSHDLKWADVVIVMEPKHEQRLLADFPGEMKYKETHVLEIPDNYKYMDPDLIEILTTAVRPLLNTASDPVPPTGGS